LNPPRYANDYYVRGSCNRNFAPNYKETAVNFWIACRIELKTDCWCIEGYCVEKKNQQDATEWFIALIICSTCFRHFYVHHQELETIYVLLPPIVFNALIGGGRRSGTGQQAMCPG
jgi:hypothetical protein